MSFEVSYLSLHRSGELKKRAEKLWKNLKSCTLCPNNCRVNRVEGKKGLCGVTADLMLSSVEPHFGEEPVLVGQGGSGTIFFTGCNLHCIYCQNYHISQKVEGQQVSIEDTAEFMLKLQEIGCSNINFVTPTPWTPHILKALDLAAEKGLTLPLVYNTGGYDSLEVLKVLSGIIDIYMPDMKYADAKIAKRLSGIDKYPEVSQAAVKEMHRQVGDLKVGEDKLAYRGLLIRHLVLPNDLAGSKKIFDFIAKKISKNTYVNVMAQYRPCYKAFEHDALTNPLNPLDHRKALELAQEAGLQV